MSQAPEDLRDRLDAALPPSCAGVDLDAVLRRGQRAARRRHTATVLVTVFAVLGVATLAFRIGVLDRSALTPADPSRVVGYATWSLADSADGHTSDYMVVVHPAVRQSQEVEFVRQTDSGQETFARSTLDLRHPVAVEGSTSDGHVTLGVVPALAVTGVHLAHVDMGAQLTPLPAVGWTAFALGTKEVRPLDEASTMLWVDDRHRPVDAEGKVGHAAEIGYGCWGAETADGATVFTECPTTIESGPWGWSRTTSTSIDALSLVASAQVQFSLEIGFQVRQSVVAMAVPSDADNVVVRDASGIDSDLPTVRLGKWRVGVHVMTLDSQGSWSFDSVRWVAGDGRPREFSLP